METTVLHHECYTCPLSKNEDSAPAGHHSATPGRSAAPSLQNAERQLRPTRPGTNVNDREIAAPEPRSLPRRLSPA